MNPLHSLARSSIAPTFLTKGLDALRHPEANLRSAERYLPGLKKLGIPGSATQIVRVSGAVQLAAGLLLFTGRFPRIASTALALSLISTTATGPRFWDEKDLNVKKSQKTEFFKNLGLFGGLVLAVVDRNGGPSVFWRAKQGVSAVSATVSEQVAQAGENVQAHAKSLLQAL